MRECNYVLRSQRKKLRVLCVYQECQGRERGGLRGIRERYDQSVQVSIGTVPGKMSSIAPRTGLGGPGDIVRAIGSSKT